MKTKPQFLFIALALSASLHQAGAQGTAFNYQGRLNSDGSPTTGLYDFRSAIYNAESNGTQVGGTITNSAVGVTNGLFTLTLDFGGGIFTGAPRWLDLSVRTNGGAFTNLTPRAALVAVPYAIYAGQASTVTNGAISVSQLQTPGVPTNGQALTYNGTSLVWQTLAPGSSAYVAKAGDTMTGTLNLPAPAILAFGASTRQMISLYDTGPYNFGIGVQTSTFYQRTVATGGFAWYEGGVHNDGQNNAGGGTTLMTLSASGNLQVNASGGVNAITGNNPTATGVGGSSSTGVGVWGVSDSGSGVAGGSGTGRGVWGYSSSGDGVYGSSGSISARGVFGYNSGGGVGVWGESTTSEGVHGESSANNAAAVAGINLNTSGGLGLYGESRGTGIGVWGKSVGSEGVHGESSSGNAAAVAGINLNTGGGAVGVYGESKGAGVGVWGKSMTFEGVHGESGSANAAAVVGVGLSTGPGVYGESRGGYGGYFIGPVRVGSLEIKGGADVAEPFQMTGDQIEKGAVVIIDEESPGHLKLSERPYDQRVAGIVSGANGIKPGISLSQQELNEGGQNVALSGRVFVLADASRNPIKPGDLLTTSNTPGHAMKVTDHAKAQGAILGKAMSGLQEGRGMVLVLVTLQ